MTTTPNSSLFDKVQLPTVMTFGQIDHLEGSISQIHESLEDFLDGADARLSEVNSLMDDLTIQEGELLDKTLPALADYFTALKVSLRQTILDHLEATQEANQRILAIKVHNPNSIKLREQQVNTLTYELISDGVSREKVKLTNQEFDTVFNAQAKKLHTNGVNVVNCGSCGYLFVVDLSEAEHTCPYCNFTDDKSSFGDLFY